MRPPSFTCLRSLTSSRCFSTSTPHFARSNSSAIEHLQSRLPPYPYGSNRWYKQSNFGLYGDRRIQFGNTVSPKTEIKNRRAWRPNIRHQRLWSAALNRFIRVKVLARVLRTIDKVGGLDEYLLGDKASRIRELGLGGWKLRWRITRTEAVMERYRRMREEMRLPPLDARKLQFYHGQRGLESSTGMASMGGVVEGHGEEVSDEVLEAMEQEEEKAFDIYLDESEKSGKVLDLVPEERLVEKQEKAVDR